MVTPFTSLVHSTASLKLAAKGVTCFISSFCDAGASAGITKWTKSAPFFYVITENDIEKYQAPNGAAQPTVNRSLNLKLNA